jgi:hypothetical protein
MKFFAKASNTGIYETSACICSSNQVIYIRNVSTFKIFEKEHDWSMPTLRVVTIENFHLVVPTFHCKCETSPDEPALLVTDSHYFQTRNLEIIEMAQANGFAIVYLLPPLTHKTQPLMCLS